VQCVMDKGMLKLHKGMLKLMYSSPELPSCMRLYLSICLIVQFLSISI
jgi:hypothetical protein